MIRAFSAEETLARAGQLAEVLLDRIAGGASVSFMEGFLRMHEGRGGSGVRALS